MDNRLFKCFGGYRYLLRNGFYIEILNKLGSYPCREIWLCNSNYRVKDFILSMTYEEIYQFVYEYYNCHDNFLELDFGDIPTVIRHFCEIKDFTDDIIFYTERFINSKTYVFANNGQTDINS